MDKDAPLIKLININKRLRGPHKSERFYGVYQGDGLPFA